MPADPNETLQMPAVRADGPSLEERLAECDAAYAAWRDMVARAARTNRKGAPRLARVQLAELMRLTESGK